MKKIIFGFFAILAVMMASSCGSSKGVVYFQNIDSISLAPSRGLYSARIMPKDELTIVVKTLAEEASEPFNLSYGKGSAGGSNGANSLLPYLVDNDGYINFPVIGKINVAGLTRTECEDLIKSKIQPYLSKNENPIVTVKLSGYKVTVTGEVSSPGVIQVDQEKMSIVEAIAKAGDLTIYGKRDNIMLLREDETGEKHYTRLNLNDANIINSPYYYLQQNDVVYVEPNHVKAKNSGLGASTTVWFSFIGIATSVASLLVSVLRD